MDGDSKRVIPLKELLNTQFEKFDSPSFFNIILIKILFLFSCKNNILLRDNVNK